MHGNPKVKLTGIFVKLRIQLLAVMLILAAFASPQSVTGQSIHFSLYAPLQKNPPVHIIGFRHGKSELGFILSNISDKTVFAVMIMAVSIVPGECLPNTGHGADARCDMSQNGGNFRVRIPPHEEKVSLPVGGVEVNWPHTIVYTAKERGVACLQVQFGVTAVFFEDGTAWPSDAGFISREDIEGSKGFLEKTRTPEQANTISRISNPSLFDPSLVEAEAGKCPGVASTANALRSVNEIVFSNESPQPDRDNGKGLPPHLRFSCSLESTKAICRMPLEADHTAMQAHPKAALQ
jgi:hypothetical protein